MIENLRSAFKDLLLEADWMEQVTRNAALVKADAIAGLMAYPDWLEESDGLEKYYNGVMCVSYQFSQNFENSIKITIKISARASDRRRRSFPEHSQHRQMVSQ
jgi:predicted metalloendopeptidase